MKRSAVVISLVLPALFLLAAQSTSAAGRKIDCSVHPPKGASKEALVSLARVSRADAEKSAMGAKGVKHGASVADSELEAEHGCLVWSFDLKMPDKPGVQEVMVDAGDGKVLSSKYESAKQEEAEKAKDAKEATKSN